MKFKIGALLHAPRTNPNTVCSSLLTVQVLMGLTDFKGFSRFMDRQEIDEK